MFLIVDFLKNHRQIIIVFYKILTECLKGSDANVLPLCRKTALRLVLDESINRRHSDGSHSTNVCQSTSLTLEHLDKKRDFPLWRKTECIPSLGACSRRMKKFQMSAVSDLTFEHF